LDSTRMSILPLLKYVFSKEDDSMLLKTDSFLAS